MWPEDVIHLSTGQTYQLSGIGHHMGETATSGHYVASLKTESGWLRCNDTKLSYSDETTIKSLLCDFFVYYKVNCSPPQKRLFREDDFPPLGTTEKKRLIHQSEYDQNPPFHTEDTGKQSTCKNCGKSFTLLLSHLIRAKKCQMGYNIDEMKKESNRQKQREFRNRKIDSDPQKLKLDEIDGERENLKCGN